MCFRRGEASLCGTPALSAEDVEDILEWWTGTHDTRDYSGVIKRARKDVLALVATIKAKKP